MTRQRHRHRRGEFRHSCHAILGPTEFVGARHRRARLTCKPHAATRSNLGARHAA
jgi:hypothetical protein